MVLMRRAFFGRLFVLVIIVEEGEIVIVIFDFAAVFERLASAHEPAAIAMREIQKSHFFRKKWYSDCMLMTIFLS